jgi:hypothetical protein
MRMRMWMGTIRAAAVALAVLGAGMGTSWAQSAMEAAFDRCTDAVETEDYDKAIRECSEAIRLGAGLCYMI